MRRLAPIVALLGALLACAGGARAAERVSLTPLRGEHFPSRSYALTLPRGVTPTSGHVHVVENGVPVDGLSVTAAATDVRRRLGEVLLVDASASMRGRPLAAAMAAARAFATRRAPGQQLAVIAFNSSSTTLLPLTSDPARIGAALRAAPRAGGGTHIYDAIETALGIVRSAHLAGTSIVVLSDGSDVGSAATAPKVLAAAHGLHARIYGVGLRSTHFSPDTLRGLADGTQGLYTEAGSVHQLEGIFRALGSRLANAYVLSYRSMAGPGRHVNVLATVDGVAGAGTAAYRSPDLAGVPVAPPATHAAWASPAAIVVISAAVGLLVALGIGVSLRTRSATVQDRVVPFVSQLGAVAATFEPEGEVATAAAAPPPPGRLAASAWWDRYCLLLDVGRTRVAPRRLLLITGFATVLVATLIAVVTGRPALGLIGLLAPLPVREVVRLRARRQRTLFADQLADNLQVVASALRAGHGFVGGFQSTVDDAPEPSRSELRRVLAEEQLGTPIEEALEIAVHRMESVDLRQVALVASVQRHTGGNAAEVLDRVIDSIRERVAMRRLIRTLTAQGRMSGSIVSALPIVLVVAVSVLSPGFTAPLFNTTGGNIVLALAAALVVAGWLVIRRIVNFEV
jgi:tight adherence protein B